LIRGSHEHTRNSRCARTGISVPPSVRHKVGEPPTDSISYFSWPLGKKCTQMAEKVENKASAGTEEKIKRSRASKPKVKTGCQTCKSVPYLPRAKESILALLEL